MKSLKHYDLQSVGLRIREERKKRFKSQNKLITALHEHGIQMGRNTLSAIENGELPELFSLKAFIGLCDIFECDPSYLLCSENINKLILKQNSEIEKIIDCGWETAKQTHQYIQTIEEQISYLEDIIEGKK